MADIRPLNCRFRLQDEGGAYPRSSCTACGKTITTGLGTACSIAAEAIPVTQADREAAAEIGRKFAKWTSRQVELTLAGEGDYAGIIQILARHRTTQ